MGVRGLQTFLKNNPCFFKSYNLYDTNIIIDAANLSCWIFIKSCEDDDQNFRHDLNGGNFVLYGEYIRRLFDAFKQSNIKPIFVFDGSVIGKQQTKSSHQTVNSGDNKALKTKTVYERGLERFNATKEATDDNFRLSIIMPQTLNFVFKQIINEYGFERIQTAYEADAHIARLAHEYQCPILSNDSDFFVFDLPVGFIMIDLIKFKFDTPMGKENFIETKLLKAENVIKHFVGLSVKTLPLFSILLGNDFIEREKFEVPLSRLARPFYAGSMPHLNCITRNHRQIATVLQWLCNKSTDEAVDSLLSAMHESDRLRARAKIEILLRTYHLELFDNLDSELNEVYPPQLGVPQQETPAEYLRRLFEHLTLSGGILDIIFQNPFFNYRMIDDFQLPSYSIVTYRPISVKISLLSTLGPRQIEEFILWDRLGDQYKPVKITKLKKLNNFGSLEEINCYNLSSLNFKQKRNLVLDTFHSSPSTFTLMLDSLLTLFSRPCALQATTICMLILYCARETRQKSKKEFVSAILLCIVFHAIQKRDAKLSEVYNHETTSALVFQLDPLKFPSNKLQRDIQHSTNENPISKFAMYRRIMHYITQLVVSVRHYEDLNSLLEEPLPSIELHSYFNSCFVYNVTKSLRTNQFTLETILRGFDQIYETFNMMTVLLDCE